MRRTSGLVTLVALTAYFLFGSGRALAARQDDQGDGPGTATLRTLEVRTVPPVAGASITVDGVPRRTDAEGVARFRVEDRGRLLDRLDGDRSPIALDATARAVLAGFHLSGEDVVAGFTVERLVRFRASEPAGNLERLELRATDGSSVVLDAPVTDTWLAVTDGSPRQGPIAWTIERFTVDGRVVDAGSLPFTPLGAEVVVVPVQAGAVEIRPVDRLFGFPIGDELSAVAPDGTEQRLSLTGTDTVDLTIPGPGRYRLSIIGDGPSWHRDVDLVAGRRSEVGFWSWIDLATLVLTALLTGALVLRVGRRLLAAMQRRDRDRPAAVSGRDPAELGAGRVAPGRSASERGPAVRSPPESDRTRGAPIVLPPPSPRGDAPSAPVPPPDRVGPRRDRSASTSTSEDRRAVSRSPEEDPAVPSPPESPARDAAGAAPGTTPEAVELWRLGVGRYRFGDSTSAQLIAVIDARTGACLACIVSATSRTSDVIAALEVAAAASIGGVLVITDGHTRFRSKEFLAWIATQESLDTVASHDAPDHDVECVERWFSGLRDRHLRPLDIRDADELAVHVEAYRNAHNRHRPNPRPGVA